MISKIRQIADAEGLWTPSYIARHARSGLARKPGVNFRGRFSATRLNANDPRADAALARRLSWSRRADHRLE
jgi:hypothetical protein